MLNVNGVNPPVPDEYDLPQPRHQQWQPHWVEYGLDYFQSPISVPVQPIDSDLI